MLDIFINTVLIIFLFIVYMFSVIVVLGNIWGRFKNSKYQVPILMVFVLCAYIPVVNTLYAAYLVNNPVSRI